MLVTAVAPVTMVGSPMLSGRRAGRAPNTPASYTSSRSGATVRLARLTAMLGRPTPTKQTRWPASSRAAATIIISDFVNSVAVAHGTSPMSVKTGLAEPPRDRDHPVGALRRAADPEAGVAPGEDPLGDRMEDLAYGSRGRPRCGPLRLLDQWQGEPFAHDREMAAPIELQRPRVIASTFAWIRAGSPSVPER